MSAEFDDFDWIISQNFPENFTPSDALPTEPLLFGMEPAKATRDAFEQALRDLPEATGITAIEQVTIDFSDAVEDHLSIEVLSEVDHDPKTGNTIPGESVVIEFMHDWEYFTIESDVMDAMTPEEQQEVAVQWHGLLEQMTIEDRVWPARAWDAITSRPDFRAFLVAQLLDTSPVECERLQRWYGGYLFNNGTHIQVTRDMPWGTYPLFSGDLVRPTEIFIAATVAGKTQYMYQRNADGTEHLKIVKNVGTRPLIQPAFDAPSKEWDSYNERYSEIYEAFVNDTSEDRIPPTEGGMHEMTRILRAALHSGLEAEDIWNPHSNGE